MKYPIGIQAFSELRRNGYVYVDKTSYIHRLIDTGKYYFLSRPRRFGKSLLLSTIEAYFRGQRELFRGLAIDSLTDVWESYPILHINLSANVYETHDDLVGTLNSMLDDFEDEYGVNAAASTPERRFARLIRNIYKTTGRQVVILIDEYDVPLLKLSEKNPEQQRIRARLKAFYGSLKSMDEYIRFGMLTGVTRFSKVSIFSDLNNLKDISMHDDYAGICGITVNELHSYFSGSIREMAEANGVDADEMARRLRENYDGYHFSEALLDVYNPFSILNAFYDKKISRYWFETGTPAFLAGSLRDKEIRLPELQRWITQDSGLRNTDIIYSNPVGVLYQAGYLTIKSHDADRQTYSLDYPNKEVKEGFLEFLLPYYVNMSDSESFFVIDRFAEALRNGDTADFMKRLQSLFADYPYDIIRDCENHYQNVLYLLFTLLGYRVDVEKKTSFSRSDLVVRTDDYIYIFEFKYDGSARAALAQIRERRYALPYAADPRWKIGVGVNFSPATRNIDDWMEWRNQ